MNFKVVSSFQRLAIVKLFTVYTIPGDWRQYQEYGGEGGWHATKIKIFVLLELAASGGTVANWPPRHSPSRWHSVTGDLHWYADWQRVNKFFSVE